MGISDTDIMKKALILAFVISCVNVIYADDILSTTKAQSDGLYVLYYNKTTGDKWSELKIPVSADQKNQSLSFSNQWMSYDATRAVPATGFPKGYYKVRKVLNGAYANHEYNTVEIVNSNIIEIEENAFQNTHISQLRFHSYANSKKISGSVLFTEIKSPVPYYVKADYILIADAQYNAWKADANWGNEDLIRCNDIIDASSPYIENNLIKLDYSKQEIPHEAGVPDTLYTNLIGNQYWEYSHDEGLTWTRVESIKSYFIDENPQKGVTLYRTLTASGEYINFRIPYYSRIPETVNTRPLSSNLPVEGSVTFTLDLEDDGYSYEWHKVGYTNILGKTNSLTITPLHSSDSGTFYCIINNPLNSVCSTNASLSVYKISQTITLNDFGVCTYGDGDITLPEKTNKGLAISYKSTNESVAKIVNKHFIRIIKPGTTNIIASQGGNDDYLEANSVTKTLVVNKAPQSIPAFSFEDKLATDANIVLPNKTSANLNIICSSSNTNVAVIRSSEDSNGSITSNVIDILKAGNTTITAKSEGDDYYLPVQASAELNVLLAPQSFVLNIANTREWGTTSTITNITLPSGLIPTFTSDHPDIVSVEVKDKNLIISALKPGVATISYWLDGNGVYEDIEGKKTITVTKRSITVVANSSETITYDRNNDIYMVPFTIYPDNNLPYEITSSNTAVAVNTEESDKFHILKAGSTQFQIKVPESDYYKEGFSSINLTVQKGTQEIQVQKDAISKLTYISDPVRRIPISSVAEAYTKISCTSSNPNVLKIIDEEICVVGVGKCTLTFSANSDECYMSAEDVLVTSEVIPGEQVITFDQIENVEFGDEFTISASSSIGTPCTLTSLTPDIVKIEGNKGIAVGCGIAEIKAIAEGTNNIMPASSTIKFVVASADVKIIVNNQKCKFGDALPEFTYDIEASETVVDYIRNTYPNVVSCSAQQLSPVGVYSIFFDAEEINKDNRISISEISDGNLEIEKLELQCSVLPEIAQYDKSIDKEPEFEVKISSESSFCPTLKSIVFRKIATTRPSEEYPKDAEYYKIDCELQFNEGGNQNFNILINPAILIVVNSGDTSIESVSMKDCDLSMIKIYSLDGKPRTKLEPGINIVRMINGKTKKIVVNVK